MGCAALFLGSCRLCGLLRCRGVFGALSCLEHRDRWDCSVPRVADLNDGTRVSAAGLRARRDFRIMIVHASPKKSGRIFNPEIGWLHDSGAPILPATKHTDEEQR